MIDMFSRDPEEVGPEHPDDLDARMRLADSIHTYVRTLDGRCGEILTRRDGSEYSCRASRWSVLHDDPDADFRERHYHGGGDCMCFEFDD